MDELYAHRALSYSETNPLPTLSDLFNRNDTDQCQTNSP